MFSIADLSNKPSTPLTHDLTRLNKPQRAYSTEVYPEVWLLETFYMALVFPIL